MMMKLGRGKRQRQSETKRVLTYFLAHFVEEKKPTWDRMCACAESSKRD